MTPIYEPRGKAKEYGDLALNIYTGCPHACFYCYGPSVLHVDKETFHTRIEPRAGVLEATVKQLEKEQIRNKTIHLCFTCDPYPTGYDTTITRDIIKAIKDAGNHVQILTKGNGERDFDLLDENDWYGITLDGLRQEGYGKRLEGLFAARKAGVKTWVSFEPVVDKEQFFDELRFVATAVDKVKIGKLNYFPSDIDWGEFGREAETLCKELGIEYYIKESLRGEMNKRRR